MRRASNERTFELISCVAPPPEWQWILATATAIGLAVLLGTRLRGRG